MPLVIRAKTVEDVPEVCGVDRLCITPPWSAQTFEGEVRSTTGYYLVAEIRGDIVAYLGATIILDEAHISTFGVHPAARRRRVGERLLVTLLNEAVKRKVRRITLEVRESNDAAQRLYRKYGFIPLSRRKAYYRDNNEDALVMWVDDTSRYAFRETLAERTAALRERAGRPRSAAER